MTRTTTGLCFAAAFGFAVTLGAQPPTPNQETKSDKASQEISVTGCLTRAADGDFVLDNARADESSKRPSAGPGPAAATNPTDPPTRPPTESAVGTTGSASSAPAMSWKLKGGTDLDKHVGHKIQVTGKTDSSGASASAASTAATAGKANQPSLDVSSIKMVASSCQ